MFDKCSEDQDLVLPILDYVNEHTLCLQNYSLSKGGHQVALTRAYQDENFREFFNKAIFDNCGLVDESVAELLSSFKSRDDFKKLVFRHSQIGKDSV